MSLKVGAFLKEGRGGFQEINQAIPHKSRTSNTWSVDMTIKCSLEVVLFMQISIGGKTQGTSNTRVAQRGALSTKAKSLNLEIT